MAEQIDSVGETQQPNAMPLQDDAAIDVAVNTNLYKIKVPIENRKAFEYIYVHRGRGGNGGTTFQYKPEENARSDWQPAIVTHPREHEEGSGKKKMLVVGLVLVDNPNEFVASGPKSTRNDEAREAAGITDVSGKRLTRALVPVTEHIARNTEFYVAVEPSHDVHQIRTIPAACVFFYSEFHPDTPQKQKTRATAFAYKCKYHAAINKNEKEEKRPVGHDPKWQAANALRVSTLGIEMTMLRLQANVWKVSRNPDLLDLLDKTLANIRKIVPTTGNDGVNAFFDLSLDFGDDEARSLLAELQSSYKHYPTMDRQVIIGVRDVLKESGQMVHLPPRHLPPFLMMVNRDLKGHTDRPTIEFEIKTCINHINIIDQYESYSSTDSMVLADKDSFVAFATVVENSLAKQEHDIRAVATQLRAHHAHLQPLTFIEDLAEKVKRTVGTTSFVSHFQEMCTIHEEQVAGAHTKAAEYIKRIRETLKLAVGEK